MTQELIDTLEKEKFQLVIKLKKVSVRNPSYREMKDEIKQMEKDIKALKTKK